MITTTHSVAPELTSFTADALSSAVIEIPFSVIRLLLPPDGKNPEHANERPIYAQNVISFLIGKPNRWPHNDDDFHRDERVEVAFGYKLRAKEGDRDNRPGGEGPWGPGFWTENGRILFKGGWRAHKAAPVIDDMFDGTFTGELALAVSNGLLTAKAQQVHVDWNGGMFNGLAGPLEAVLATKLMVYINDEIRSRYLDPLTAMLLHDDRLSALARRVSADITGASIRLTVRVD